MVAPEVLAIDRGPEPTSGMRSSRAMFYDVASWGRREGGV